jgi:hypothetical protein
MRKLDYRGKNPGYTVNLRLLLNLMHILNLVSFDIIKITPTLDIE